MGVIFNSKPHFRDTDVTDQTGKVFIITGATSGVGELLAGILYAKHAKVYVAARSADKAEQTIKALKAQHPQSKGDLVFLKLDLNDLSSIKASADSFLSQESKLNVLWNNAGVMLPPEGSTTAQGHEQQLGTNTLAPFLFTKLLTPLLQKTAATEPAGSVRVVWVASSAAERYAPQGGVVMSNLDYAEDKGSWHKYGVSKAGNILHGAEYARQHKDIVSVSLDPGNLKTALWKGVPKWQMPFLNIILKEPIYGAYTELFAGLSPEVGPKQSGRFIQPFGKVGSTRSDIETSRKGKAEGGNGIAEEFYEWTEKQIAAFE